MSAGVTSEMPVLSASAFGDPYCAHCGTELHDDQEWCLECGAARTLIHRPPDWRIPVAIAATILLLVLAGFAIALTNLSKRTNAATASAPATAQTASPAPTAAAGQTASGQQTPPVATAVKPIGSWPVGLSGWTVVLFSSHAKARADARAAGLIAGGLRVGELNSSLHPNFTPGYWIVFAGRYPHGTDAAAAAARLRNSGHPTARARQVARPGGL